MIDGPAPVRELLERLRDMPIPPDHPTSPVDLRELPGGIANTTHGEDVARGVGYAIGFKNVGFGEGFDDFSTARVRVSLVGGEPLVEVHTAAAEVGQGLVTVLEQIARTELGFERVVVAAGRHDGRLRRLVVGVAAELDDGWRRAPGLRGRARAPARAGRGAPGGGDGRAPPPAHLAARSRDRPGRRHMALCFAAHRAVCDVDTALGLVRVVEVATTQDVGRIMNLVQCEGQVQGGIAQGLGPRADGGDPRRRRRRRRTRASPTT